MRICALSTKDNPYNYFQKPDEWEAYENFTGGRCYKMLGRFAYTSDSLSISQNAKEMERAIDEIIKYDPLNQFVKLVKEVPDPE